MVELPLVAPAEERREARDRAQRLGQVVGRDVREALEVGVGALQLVRALVQLRRQRGERLLAFAQRAQVLAGAVGEPPDDAARRPERDGAGDVVDGADVDVVGQRPGGREQDREACVRRARRRRPRRSPATRSAG